MKRINILLYLGLGLIFANISCSDDRIKELTELTTDRYFSPTGMSARIVNQTGVQLTWKKNSAAKAYIIELFANGELNFEGSPVKKIEGITNDQIPYTIIGLDGATNYSARIKVIGAEVADSKWSTITFKTNEEQIMKPVSPEGIQATSVRLNWTAGEEATTITVNPGNIVHPVTPQEIAAGEATVTGLVGETAYTATLLKGNKIRGTATFTTLIDLGDAVVVQPTDDLAAVIGTAKAGDVLALMPGTYSLAADVLIDKAISIKGAKPADRPLVKSAYFNLDKGASLSLKDLMFDGENKSGGNCFITLQTGAFGNIRLEDSKLINYPKGLVYGNFNASIETVIVNNNIFDNFVGNGNEFVDFRNAIAKNFEFTNNTVFNAVLNREFIRMDAGGSTAYPAITSIIKVNNNTFYNVIQDAAKRFFYVRLAKNEITFSKNLIVKSLAMTANQSATNLVERKSNNYFDAVNFYNSSASGVKNDVVANGYTLLDPGFKDAGKGDFTVTNQTLKDDGIGDPRWVK